VTSPRLFQQLVRSLDEGGYRLSLGSESPSAPFVQVVTPPERRSLAATHTVARRTLVRLSPGPEYLAYLDSSFPRLYKSLQPSCDPRAAFLIVERWVRHVGLGERLLLFAHDHGLNLRCVDYTMGENRVNGSRIVFDQASRRWRLEEGRADELLRDPRRRDRTWLSGLDPRWPLHRAARLVNSTARRAVASVVP
jgi:hypothetical protein